MLTLTDKAVEVLKTVLDGQGLRIGVDAGGCSGLQYRMGLESEPTDGDDVLEFSGVQIFVDPASSLWLHGVTVDFVEGAEGAGFKFDNPNAAGKCACSAGSCG